MLYPLILVMTLLGAMGAFFFKQSAQRADTLAGLFLRPQLYLGGGFYVAGAAFNILLLRYLDYSVLYPMTSVTYVWTLLLARLLLKEPVTAQKLAGVAAICVGVCLLAI